MNFFVKRLNAFRQFPRSAALAAKCIRLLNTLVSGAGEGIDEMQAYCKVLPPVLEDAYRYGKSFNALLEREASDLSQTVNSHL